MYRTAVAVPLANTKLAILMMDNLAKLEERIVQDRAGRLVLAEQRYQNDLTKNVREAEFRRRNQEALETLLQDLRAAMNTTAL